jgi:CHAD domain-containing protein
MSAPEAASSQAAAKAAPPAMSPSLTAAEGFRVVMRGCVAQLLANDAPARAGDVEGVHQMRVAVRRLRSALRLFRPRGAAPQRDNVAGELKWLGRALGRQRDWDVFCEDTLPGLGEDAPALAALAAAAAARRQAARARLAETLAAPRCRALLAGLPAWVESDDWRVGRDRQLEAVAGRLLDRLARRVRKAGRRIGRLDDAERHELRKAVKKLRYGVEFLGDLYPGRRVRRYLKPMKRLQQRLGELNDLVAAAAQIEQLGPEPPTAAAEAAACLGERRARRLAGLKRRWRDFAAARPFW